MASGSLGNLTVDLLLETAQWISGLNKAEYEGQKFADAIGKKMDAMADKVSSSLKSMAAGVIAGFAVENIVGFINETQKAADSLDELAQSTATSVQFLAEIGITAAISGSSLEGVAKSMGKFNKATVEAFADPKSQPAQIFKALNIELKDSHGTVKDTETLYKEFALAMGGLEDSAFKVTAAQKIGGKSAAEQIPLWNALARQTLEVAAANKVYGEEMAKLAPVAGALEEQQSLMHTNSKVMAALLGEQLIPYFTVMIKQWNEATASGAGLAPVVTNLMNAFKGVVIFIDGLVVGLTLLAKTAIASAKILAALKDLDFKAAGAAITDLQQSVSDGFAGWEERTKAILLPMDQLTASTFKAKKASDEFNKAAGSDAAEKAHEKAARAAEKLRREEERLAKQTAAGMQHIEDMLRSATREIPMWNIDPQIRALDEKFETATRGWNSIIRDGNKQAMKDLEAQWGGLFKAIDDLGRGAFDALFDNTSDGWKSLMNSMKNSFKKLLVDFLYTQMAKPFVMQILAQTPGGIGQVAGNQLAQMQSSGIGQIGGYAGLGEWARGLLGGGSEVGIEGSASFVGPLAEGAGGLGGMFGTGPSMMSGAGWGAGYAGVAGIAGGLIGGYGAGALGAGQRGVAAGQQWGSTLATVGLMVGGPIGAAIGAALGVAIGKFTDPDPDAMRTAVFGSLTGAEGVTQYTGKSAFGSFGFSSGEWLSDADMGEALTNVISGITAMDNALAAFMSPEQIADVTKRLDEAAERYQLGMEHGSIGGLEGLMKDRIAIIARGFSEGLGDFVDAFAGDVKDLSAIVGGYVQAHASALAFDPRAIVDAAKPMALADSLTAQSEGLTEFIAGMDTSAASMGELNLRMADFQMATVQMVAAIDAIIASIHQMFASTSEQIALALMTTQQQYEYFQAQADADFAALKASTDPEEIARLSKKINDEILAAWNLLDEGQRAILGPEFLARIAEVDAAVGEQLGGIQDAVVEDAADVMGSIVDRLDVLFASATTTAATNQQAADTQLDAANTPLVVVVQDGSALVTGP